MAKRKEGHAVREQVIFRKTKYRRGLLADYSGQFPTFYRFCRPLIECLLLFLCLMKEKFIVGQYLHLEIGGKHDEVIGKYAGPAQPIDLTSPGVSYIQEDSEG